ncbi:hypothetical protein [Psychrobacillus vulpis]|uniref:Uncharacterized protein n=1 Tax=Psychrobacillus vulpis TaxID=2325572 RepID=A0A544T9X0_9BACI|nr:hypothetical protein [Psychrobacillus vulpis]TQR14247.1 hypothetical protein FG384_19610 [Psychrobacillus vulpis]
MRFTFIFGIAGILYSIFWHRQSLIPPTDIFIPIATGALIDILILLSISKHRNVLDEEIEKVSNEEIEQELEDYLKG